MNAEIFGALRLLEKERGISMDFMLEKINKAILQLRHYKGVKP